MADTAGRRASALLLLATLALLLAGCATGGLPPAPSVPPSQAPSPVAPPPASASPSEPVTPPPTEVPGPPSAAIDRATLEDGSPAAGSLGSFSWDGLTSDAPWIVPSRGVVAAAGSPLTIAFAPAFPHVGWEARWAPITPGAGGDRVAGDPVAGGEGQGGPIGVTAPAAPGGWGLMVETSFGQGRSGAWYWRVDVVP